MGSLYGYLVGLISVVRDGLLLVVLRVMRGWLWMPCLLCFAVDFEGGVYREGKSRSLAGILMGEYNLDVVAWSLVYMGD